MILRRVFLTFCLALAISLGGLTPANAIIGGTQVATPNPYPWNALLHVTTNQSNFTCGVTLIGSRFAITAAHCLEGIDLSTAYITVGGYDLDVGQTSGQTIHVSSYVKHPDYNVGTLTHDLALIILDGNANNVETPIYITQTEISPGRTATILGWGDTVEGGVPVSELRQAQVQTIDRATCEAVLSGYGFAFDASTICAGVASGAQDTCDGDSGGPLFIVGPDGKPVQIGVTSWGIGCGRAGFPGAYSNLSDMLGFLLNSLGSQVAVNLVDYALDGNQRKVALIFDQIGAAAADGTSLKQDYGRLFMNGVAGTAKALQSLLPTSAFEMIAMVQTFVSMENSNIMPRLRSLREGTAGGMLDVSGMRMINVGSAGSVDRTTGLSNIGNDSALNGSSDLTGNEGFVADSTNASTNAEKMYSPNLYADNSIYRSQNYNNQSAQDAPIVLGGQPQQVAMQQQTYATQRTMNSYQMQPSNGYAVNPTWRQPPTQKRAGGAIEWVSSLFGGHDVENSPRPNLPRTATYTSRDLAYEQASRYPGQPLGMYARNMRNNSYQTATYGASASTVGQQESVRVDLPNQYAMVLTDPNDQTFDDAATYQPAAASVTTFEPASSNTYVMDPADRIGTIAVPINKPATINADRRWGVFMSGDVRFGDETLLKQGGDTAVDNTGFTVGVDYRVVDKSFIGMALSYAHGSFTTGDLSDVQGDGYAVSLYGTTSFLKSAYLDGFISFGYNTFDSERTLWIGNGQHRTASAEPDAYHFSGKAEAGYDFARNAWKFGPFVGMKFSYANFGAYTETGGGNFDLNVYKRTDFSAIGSFGVGASRRFVMPSGGVVAPSLRMAYNHEFGDKRADVESNFVSAPTMPFVTQGAQRELNWVSFNPSVSAALANNWIFQADYEHDFMRYNVDTHIFNLAARYKW